MYQTNDGNGRKSCASPLRARARTDDADTGEGSAAGGREKLEAGDGGGGEAPTVCVRRIPKPKDTDALMMTRWGTKDSSTL